MHSPTPMLPIFPYWKFTIQSSLSQQQALERLSDAVAPVQQRFILAWDARPQEFTGNFSANEFRIERIIQYRNSFLPTIYGRFFSTETGLRIRVVMALDPLVRVVGIGLSLCALPILASIGYRFTILGHFDPALKIPSLLIAFFYLMFTGGFAYEAVIARRLLNGIFESELPTGQHAR